MRGHLQNYMLRRNLAYEAERSHPDKSPSPWEGDIGDGIDGSERSEQVLKQGGRTGGH